jgi:DNA-directed RNA polymerase subunit RPC12/RpoP
MIIQCPHCGRDINLFMRMTGGGGPPQTGGGDPGPEVTGVAGDPQAGRRGGAAGGDGDHCSWCGTRLEPDLLRGGRYCPRCRLGAGGPGGNAGGPGPAAGGGGKG